MAVCKLCISASICVCCIRTKTLCALKNCSLFPVSACVCVYGTWDKSAERGNVVNAICVIRISDDNVMPTRVE